MQRPPARRLFDLCLATETVGQHQSFRRKFTQPWSKLMLINLHREVVFVLLETEAAGHAAAPVVEDFRVGSHTLKQFFLGVETDDRFLVAMSVNNDVLMQNGRLVILPRKEFREGKNLRVQAPGVLVVRSQIEHLVPEYRQTARLQTDHRHTGFDPRFQMNENVTEKLAGLVEKSVVI